MNIYPLQRKLFSLILCYFALFGNLSFSWAEVLPQKVYSSSVLPPFPKEGRFEHLAIPGYLPAAIGIPTDPQPKPILVALHGSFDQPEWHLETWYPLFQKHAFLLCTRGIKRVDSPQDPAFFRYVYREIEPELLLGMKSLQHKFSSQISSGPMMYLGFSQGAILGVPFLVKHAEQFPKAILIEGGTRWTLDMAKTYAKRGGKKILFACGQQSCHRRALASAETLQKVGIDVKVVYAAGMGHTYVDEVAHQIQEKLPWFLE